MFAAELSFAVVVGRSFTVAPRRRAAVPVHPGESEWCWCDREAIVHPQVPLVYAAVLCVAGDSPETVSGTRAGRNSVALSVLCTVMASLAFNLCLAG